MPIQAVPNNNESSVQRVARLESSLHERKLNWGAIFAGTWVTLGVSATLLLLGNAVGLIPSNLIDPSTSNGLLWGTFAYDLAAVIISFGMGGYLTTRIAQTSSLTAAQHAVTQWALSLSVGIVLGVLGSSVFSAIIRGLGPTMTHWLFFCAALGGAITTLWGSQGASRSRPAANYDSGSMRSVDESAESDEDSSVRAGRRF